MAPFDEANAVLGELSEWIEYGVQGVHSLYGERERESALRSGNGEKREKREGRKICASVLQTNRVYLCVGLGPRLSSAWLDSYSKPEKGHTV